MNEYVQEESQGAWWRLSQEQQKQLIVLLGQMMRHHMEGTIQKKEVTARNAVDKTPCVRQAGVHLKREVL